MPASEHTATQRLSAGQLFQYPFRIFFLSLALLAVLVVPLWVMVVTGTLDLPLAMPGLFWHQHEMIFALLEAAVAGFLLTAVCVWTGTERLHGAPLLGLWGVWLAGRVALLLGSGWPEWLVFGLNLLFVPLVMLDAGRRVVRVRQWRQLPILLVLLLLWLMELGFFLAPAGPYAAGALIMAMALMLIIGGRITPAFTANWLKGQGAQPGPRMKPSMPLDLSLVGLMVLLLATYVLDFATGVVVLAPIAALGCLWRHVRWQGWRIAREPLLWILHLSLLWIPVALVLMALEAAGWYPKTVWVHAAGIGAMAGLILGVISRVALGHTGRPLKLPAGMVWAFAAIHLAAVVRVVTAMGLLSWKAGIDLTAVSWVVAFLFFLVRYTGILCGPRADAKPG
ncbi:NnrS family protein [Marinobacteraceae bacterium S3BR75-40.1]